MAYAWAVVVDPAEIKKHDFSKILPFGMKMIPSSVDFYAELFLRSAEKSLLIGGRIIMIEPSNNYWSRFVYKLIGHEPFDTRQIEWKFESKDPLLDSNQALSWIIFERDYQKFKNLFPRFSLIQKKNMMPFSYLLSGGHSFNTRIGKLIRITRSFEKFFFDKYLGMFNLICLEKI